MADIDGFKLTTVASFDYMRDAWLDYGLDAHPALVVTEGVKANPKGLELSPADKGTGRNYAQAEMYYGRIDAYSIGRGIDLPNVNETLLDREVQLIRDYLWRNHLWRKGKIIRDEYKRMYIFRSADFVGNSDDKDRIEKIWRAKPKIEKIMSEDAKRDAVQAANCGKDVRPEVTLYADVNFQGRSLILDWDAPDLNNTSIGNFLFQVSSLKVDLKGGKGGVVLFRRPYYEGVGEVFTADDNDLGDNNLGDNLVSSVKVLTCLEFNSPSYDCKESLFWRLKGPWRIADLGAHGYEQGFTLSNGARCLNELKGRMTDGESNDRRARLNLQDGRISERSVSKDEILNLGADIKFLINHSCQNGQTLAPGNVATCFLFKNKMLAQWAWAGSGTTEHEILHQDLCDGDRFGVAVMKNYDGQMAAPGSNPWRSYFTSVLGDPTLRIFYEMPDLYVKSVKISPRAAKVKDFPRVTIIIENKGDREVDQNLQARCLWAIYPVGRPDGLGKDTFSIKPLRAGEEATHELSINKKLSPGLYEFRVIVDDDQKITEVDENNNEASENFEILGDRTQQGNKRFLFSIKAGGTYARTSAPIFVAGDLSTESLHREYTSWQEFGISNSLSPAGGIYVQSFFSPALSLEVGVSYEVRSGMTKYPAWPEYYDRTTFGSVAVPAVLKLNFGRKTFGFFVGAGIEGSYIVALKNHYHNKIGQQVYDVFSAEVSDGYHQGLRGLLRSPLSFSGIGLGGFRAGKVTFEARYLLGLKDMILTVPVGSAQEEVNAGKFRGFSALIGFSF